MELGCLCETDWVLEEFQLDSECFDILDSLVFHDSRGDFNNIPKNIIPKSFLDITCNISTRWMESPVIVPVDTGRPWPFNRMAQIEVPSSSKDNRKALSCKHPDIRKLTPATFNPPWKSLKINGWKMNFLLGWPIFRCYVSSRECKATWTRKTQETPSTSCLSWYLIWSF